MRKQSLFNMHKRLGLGLLLSWSLCLSAATVVQIPNVDTVQTNYPEDWPKQFSVAESQAYQALFSQWPQNTLPAMDYWVYYPNQSQLVVDFARNEIRFTQETLFTNEGTVDYLAMRQLAIDELKSTLSLTLNQALSLDPLLSQLPKAYQPQLIDDPLLFSELQSLGDAQALVDQMMRHAEWLFPEYSASRVATPIKVSSRMTLKVPLPEQRLLLKAQEIHPRVLVHARANGLPMSLIHAVIHTESSYNPLARSPIPAFGLMQVVPTTAGLDASKKLFGEPLVPSPAFLFEPENNLLMGTTYFNLLYSNYFRSVDASSLRIALSIAAYNGGLHDTVKAFHRGGRLSQAVPIANAMAPDQALQQLRTKIPMQETRNYLNKVLERMAYYERVLPDA